MLNTLSPSQARQISHSCRQEKKKKDKSVGIKGCHSGRRHEQPDTTKTEKAYKLRLACGTYSSK